MSHEDWEAGLHLPYNPHQMAMKKQVIRQPPRGATRSERKMFITAERKRHADLGLEEEKKCLGQELNNVQSVSPISPVLRCYLHLRWHYLHIPE